MKTLILYSFLFASFFAKAQGTLPLDEQGKVAFSEIVVSSMKKETLFTNAKSWLTDQGFTLEKQDTIAGTLTASNEAPLYDKGYISKKIHGKVKYQVTIDVKDNKYRYNFTDFTFIYYKENRNYRMVPSGKAKPMEEPKAEGWQNLWNAHKRTTKALIENKVSQLKMAMLILPKSTTPVATQPQKDVW